MEVLTDLEKLKIHGKECKFCDKVFFGLTKYNQHLKPCGLYSKFLKKTAKGFQCQFCYCLMPSQRNNCFKHIKNYHKNEEKFKKNKKKVVNIVKKDAEIMRKPTYSSPMTLRRTSLKMIPDKSKCLYCRKKFITDRQKQGYR